jgi:hypothetical protein
MKQILNYNIEKHVHRFSSWCASTAARASKSNRFKVKRGTEILEDCEVFTFLGDPSKLPTPADFDETHRKWRKQVIKASGSLKFKDGVAAKLINCYLKSSMINRYTINDPKVKAIHPPIDRILLGNVKIHGPLKFPKGIPKSNGIPAWSKLESDQYEEIIQCLKDFLGYKIDGSGPGLWELEKYWWIS